MNKFSKDDRLGSRLARERGDAPPLFDSEQVLQPTQLELCRPIKVKDKEITEVIINVPTVADILAPQFSEATEAQTLQSLAKACETEVTPAVLKTMHPRDFNKLSQIYFAYGEN